MKQLIAASFIFFNFCTSAQADSSLPIAGNKAPSFILRDGKALESVTMPYMHKITLLYFWSSTDLVSGLYNDWLKRLSKKYRNTSYQNADGFEIIAIAVQTDRAGWQETIKNDSLGVFVNGIAAKGYLDEVCLKYNVTEIPARILIDEEGKILSVNPSMLQIENILDQKKNFQPVKKTISGILAQSSTASDVLKFSNVYLFSYYGDSLFKRRTNDKGQFFFYDLSINHDYILKTDNKVDINTSDPIALYSAKGDFITDGRTRDEGFVFSLSSRICNRLISEDTTLSAAHEEIDVIKSLTFSANGASLTARDMKELLPLVNRLKSNPLLQLELTTHTDARMDASAALELTSRQANTLKDYFQAKGIPPTRVKAIARGNSEQRKLCDGTIDCREEDHLMNRRVEFIVYKN
jgi:outer membrane protein OmpA-like peptidoglycan-associated protein